MKAAVDEQIAWLALAELGRSGTDAWLALARAAGGARRAFNADDATVRAAGISARGLAALRAFDRFAQLEVERRRCEASGIEVLTIVDDVYPALLRRIGDPPLVLYCRGRSTAVAPPVVSIVGARRATRYGCRTAFAIARALAGAGVCVASGMALGIDAAAHEGALAAGTTMAVLAGGVDRVYPARNRDLYGRIVERGAILSEFPPGTPPLAHHFPIRNRIVTGVAIATVVVEADRRSGSLVSARWALDQGREVLAVPGNIDVSSSRGTNELIRDGCVPILDPAAVVEVPCIRQALPQRDADAEGQGKTAIRQEVSDPEARAILGLLDPEGVHLDEIVAGCSLDESTVMEKLTSLELDGLVERLPGGTYAPSAAG